MAMPAENADLRQQLKLKDSEIDQLHTLLHIMRSDLEVKEEQFDVLYRSLRASREHSQQESRVQESQQETRLLEALARIRELEAAVATHSLERRTWQAELQKARVAGYGASGVAPAGGAAGAAVGVDGAGRAANPPILMLDVGEDLLRICMGFASAPELVALACCGQALRRLSLEEPLWAKLHESHFGLLAPSAATSRKGGALWAYANRFRTERNWRKGSAQTVTLRGHNGTITCLSLDRPHAIVSGSDDGSLVYWHCARRSFGSRRSLRSSGSAAGADNFDSKGRAADDGEENVHGAQARGGGGGGDDEDDDEWSNHLRPPPALALAQLAEKNRRPTTTSMLSAAMVEEISSLVSLPASLMSSVSSSSSSSSSSGTEHFYSSGDGSLGGGGGSSSSIGNSGIGLGSSLSLSVGSSSSGGGGSGGGGIGGSGGALGGGVGVGSGGSGGNGHGLTSAGGAAEGRVYGAGRGAELCAWPPKSAPVGGLDDGLSSSHYYEFEKLRAFHGHGGPVWCLAIDDASGRLVSGSYDRTLKIWDLSSGSCSRTLRGHTGWVSCVAWLPTHFASSSSSSSTSGGGGSGAGDGLGATSIVSGSWDATIRIWDASAGALRRTLHCGAGNALYCLDGGSGNGGGVGIGGGGAQGGRGESGGIIAVGCRHRQVQVWDLEAGRCLQELHGHLKEVGAVHVSGSTICSGSGDTLVKVWDMRASSGACRATLRGHSSTVMCVQHDGVHRVVSGSVDKTIKIWDLRRPDQAPLQSSFEEHAGAVFAVKFDNDRVVSGSSDGLIKVLNFRQRA